MNIELSSVVLKLISDAFRTGLFGGTPEETARRLIEERLRQLIADGTIKPTRGHADRIQNLEIAANTANATLLRSMQIHGSDPCHITEAREALTAALS